MPFAKFLYDVARKCWNDLPGKHSEWDFLTETEKERWEEYARLCSAYFVP